MSIDKVSLGLRQALRQLRAPRNRKMSRFVKTDSAREGRLNQVYSKTTGARVVAGCIPLNNDKTKLIMITSSKHKDRWIIPKGGVETDEADDFSKTALRETWEEAGAIGAISHKLKVIEDHRFVNSRNKSQVDLTIDGEEIPKSEFHLFEMIVEELSTEWPESHKRERRWCTYSEAKHELLKSDRPELLEALGLSSIIKDIPFLEFGSEGTHVDKQVQDDEY